jgi:Regulator of chromosome condensation (RCC1) repeat
MKKIGLLLALLALIVSGVAKTQSSDAPWASYSLWYSHSCALVKDGTAYCWGDNSSGVLGTDTQSDNRKVPTLVKTDQKFSSISVGANHTCGIAKNGQTYCWGRNDRAQLGFNSNGSRKPNAVDQLLVPAAIQTDQKFSSVSAGMFGTCALTAEGKAYCWGGNFNGEIGSDPGASESATPLAVKGKLVFASIQAGRTLVCGLTKNGEAYCWGANGTGQFGDGSNQDQFAPTRAGGEMIFSSISVGEFHVCGVTKDNKGYCWGNNLSGKLGSGDGILSDSKVPLLVTGKLALKNISASRVHACGLTTEGKAWCWGSGISGQLGVGITDDYTATPVAVNTKMVFSSIQAGNTFTCAMAMDKNIWCWGGNSGGQLGNDSTQGTNRPVLVETP